MLLRRAAQAGRAVRDLATCRGDINRIPCIPPATWATQMRGYAPISMPSWGGGGMVDKLKGLVMGGPSGMDDLDLSKTYTIDDHALALGQFAKMANMAKLAGMAGMVLSPQQTKEAEAKIAQMTSIVEAMTAVDKLDPVKLSGAAHRRIATQAGVSASDVNTVIYEFATMKARMDKMRELKAAGKPMPENAMELEKAMAPAPSLAEKPTAKKVVQQGGGKAGAQQFTRQSVVRTSAAPSAVESAGKNAKCACNSGKKYKRCCMPQ